MLSDFDFKNIISDIHSKKSRLVEAAFEMNID